MEITPRLLGKSSATGGLEAKKYQVQAGSGFDAGLDPTKSAVTVDSKGVLADYYRNGKYNSKGEKELPSKSITPFETGPASIRIFGKNAKGSKTNTDQDIIPPYTKFILESTQEGHVERSQIIETFGDFYVFFFGERPPIYTFSGTLVNTQDVSWVSDFYEYYNNLLRGSKCVEKNARLVITYGGAQIEGYILSFNLAKSAATDSSVPIGMQVVVTKRNSINLSSDFGVVITDQQIQVVLESLNRLAGKTGKGLAALNVSDAFGNVKSAMGGGMASRSYAI
jgi:hypothetical protein